MLTTMKTTEFYNLNFCFYANMFQKALFMRFDWSALCELQLIMSNGGGGDSIILTSMQGSHMGSHMAAAGLSTLCTADRCQ